MWNVWYKTQIQVLAGWTHEGPSGREALSVSLPQSWLQFSFSSQTSSCFRCPYCDYRGSSSSLLNHHKRRAHVAEFDMEKKEKERKEEEKKFLRTDGRVGTPIEGSTRGPRGPKNYTASQPWPCWGMLWNVVDLFWRYFFQRSMQMNQALA